MSDAVRREWRKTWPTAMDLSGDWRDSLTATYQGYCPGWPDDAPVVRVRMDVVAAGGGLRSTFQELSLAEARELRDWLTAAIEEGEG